MNAWLLLPVWVCRSRRALYSCGAALLWHTPLAYARRKWAFATRRLLARIVAAELDFSTSPVVLRLVVQACARWDLSRAVPGDCCVLERGKRGKCDQLNIMVDACSVALDAAMNWGQRATSVICWPILGDDNVMRSTGKPHVVYLGVLEH